MKTLRWFLTAFVIAIGFIVLWLAFAPPRFWLNLTKRVDLVDAALTGSSLVEQYDCRGCHVIDAEGQPYGPTLDGVSRRLDSVSLRIWLRDPAAIIPDTKMPNFHLSDSEVEALVAYLKEIDR